MRDVVVASLSAAAAFALYAHATYALTRRLKVLDQQPLLHTPCSVHSATLVRVKAASDVVAQSAEFSRALTAAGARVVYLGRVGACVVQTEQVSCDWSAVVVCQHASKEAAAKCFAASGVQKLLCTFEDSYTLHYRRFQSAGLAAPVLLSACKLHASIFGGVGAPFTRAKELRPQVKRVHEAVAAGLEGCNPEAVVIFNLLRKHPDPEAARGDRQYGRSMMRMLGEVGGGPTHLGCVELCQATPEIKRPWQTAALVHYPGKEFFLRLVQSTFMDRVGEGKKLDDSLAVLTVPMRIPAASRL